MPTKRFRRGGKGIDRIEKALCIKVEDDGGRPTTTRRGKHFGNLPGRKRRTKTKRCDIAVDCPAMLLITSSGQKAIISLYQQHKMTHHLKPGCRPSVTFKFYFVSKVRRLSFSVLRMTVNDPSTLRVPEVVAYFASGERMACFVMEFIDATTPVGAVYEKVTNALQ
ncbi:hypothetical protein EDD16DRAFT_1524607 [Pisolithus croceorrhizus]|nr:hypothetical protein EDD16DRAFT_1524607 [Pisolithus croceorrhizus]